MRTEICKSERGNKRRETYYVGWIGERSVPITFALGYWSAKSMAHFPVPVAKSRTFSSGIWSTGEKASFPSNRFRKRAC